MPNRIGAVKWHLSFILFIDFYIISLIFIFGLYFSKSHLSEFVNLTLFILHAINTFHIYSDQYTHQKPLIVTHLLAFNCFFSFQIKILSSKPEKLKTFAAFILECNKLILKKVLWKLDPFLLNQYFHSI